MYWNTKYSIFFIRFYWANPNCSRSRIQLCSLSVHFNELRSHWRIYFKCIELDSFLSRTQWCDLIIGLDISYSTLKKNWVIFFSWVQQHFSRHNVLKTKLEKPFSRLVFWKMERKPCKDKNTLKEIIKSIPVPPVKISDY